MTVVRMESGRSDATGTTARTGLGDEIVVARGKERETESGIESGGATGRETNAESEQTLSPLTTARAVAPRQTGESERRRRPQPRRHRDARRNSTTHASSPSSACIPARTTPSMTPT